MTSRRRKSSREEEEGRRFCCCRWSSSSSSRNNKTDVKLMLVAMVLSMFCVDQTRAMKASAKVSLSETTKKHETIDAFGFDDQSSLTFQKLRVTVFGGNEIINATTTTMLPNVYLSLCPMDENANVENEASMSDANGARCEVSVAKLDETKACQFVAFAGADNASDTSEGQRKRRRRRRRNLLTGTRDDDDANVVFEKEYAPMQIEVNKKKTYDIAFFTCDSKGKTIEIDVEYETLNDGKHHLDTSWQPIISVYLYILLFYVLISMLQMTHAMSMCAIYRNQSLVSALHYAMWTTQFIRMVHLGVSWTHFNYIDSNGTLNDSYHHGMLICSSLKETTFWTMILAIAGGWRVTSDRVSTTQKSTIYTAMLLLFLCNILVQMDLGIRTVYFVYNLVYCSIISMTIFWSSKTIQTLREQYEIFRQSGATAEDLARAPVKAKEGMYHTFYVVFVTFSGFKVLNQILYAYYRRDSAWVHSFFSEFLDSVAWCFLLVLFRPKDQTYSTSFPANGFDPFGYDASIRAAQMGVVQRGTTHLPDIYVAEVSAASKILRDIGNNDVAIPSDQSSDSGAASRTSASVESIELYARGVLPSSPRSVSAAAAESSASVLDSLAGASGDVEQGFSSRGEQTNTNSSSSSSPRARMNVYVVENPPTKRDSASLSESISLAIKTEDIEAHRAREKRERTTVPLAAAPSPPAVEDDDERDDEGPAGAGTARRNALR